MIPLSYIVAWRQFAPWISDQQIEQDLVISRALVALFQQPHIVDNLAFRGGTALNKLFFYPPARYSEDIDLVQIHPKPIGETINAIRAALDHWLGTPSWRQKHGRVTLYYQFLTESLPQIPCKLKIEINTCEHFSLYDYHHLSLKVSSEWFSGQSVITTFNFNELMGTKVRALYQRKKGRDLFDLWLALSHNDFDVEKTLNAFQFYMEKENKRITRAQFESNLAEKFTSHDFHQDIEIVKTPEIIWDLRKAEQDIAEKILSKIPGEPWKGKLSKTTD